MDLTFWIVLVALALAGLLGWRLGGTFADDIERFDA